MQQCLNFTAKLCAVSSVVVLLVTAVGCQTWQSSSVVPNLLSSKGEREIVRQAKQESFPSPSDVGMKETL